MCLSWEFGVLIEMSKSFHWELGVMVNFCGWYCSHLDIINIKSSDNKIGKQNWITESLWVGSGPEGLSDTWTFLPALKNGRAVMLVRGLFIFYVSTEWDILSMLNQPTSTFGRATQQTHDRLLPSRIDKISGDASKDASRYLGKKRQRAWK